MKKVEKILFNAYEILPILLYFIACVVKEKLYEFFSSHYFVRGLVITQSETLDKSSKVFQ